MDKEQNQKGREVSAILAGLRLLQRVDEWPDGIGEIATHGRKFVTLDAGEIDALCERINMGSWSNEVTQPEPES